MNVKSILCPVDYSDNSRFALAYAERLAKESDATLHVVHCYVEVVPYETGMGAPIYEPLDVEAEVATLNQFAPKKEGVNYRHELIKGREASAITEYADDHNIDLIVMGTHGRTGLARLLMGSVAEQVLRHASCPVMTIRQPANELQESSE